MQTPNEKPITPEDFRRIEDKLDRLLKFFNVDNAPGRSTKELAAMADRVVFDFEAKQKKRRK